MSESTIIYIDRLKGGTVQKICAKLPPTFLEIEEKDLYFRNPVEIEGIVYLTEDDLVLRLSASTIAQMACSICNQILSLPLSVKNTYHTEQLEGIPTALFDFKDIVREALLVELPKLAECSGGNCPERATIAPYLHKESPKGGDDFYFPFSELKQK